MSVVVIDNQSTDRTVEIVKSNYPQVKLIENQTNMGFGKANNIGIKWAYNQGADYFFLLNQDAWVEPETVGCLVDKQKQNPEFGILSPLHLFNSQKLDQKFKSYLKGRGDEVIDHLSPEEQDTIFQVRFVNAALWLVSRQCIETVGLFAPIFDHYGEDLNFAHRCKFHNIKIGIYPRAIGYHERDQSPSKAKELKMSKLMARDRNYCLGVLLNLKHSFARQWMFLFFTGLKEIILFLFLMKFKTIAVILNRVRFVGMISELINQRKEMKTKGAFLKLY
jgi:GT2 family glycosyltransferase